MTFYSFKCGITAALILIILPFITKSPVYGQDNVEFSDKIYLDSLVSRAIELKLHQTHTWHVLVHYRKSLFGYKSLIDDPAFFLSQKGKTDPVAELDATIRAFYSPVKNNTSHPLLKFPARFKFLDYRLSFDRSKLPIDGETAFSNFYNSINPKKIYLVFPAGYLNSPASMYGHTLLLIESHSGSRLIAKAINYAAITNETFGPLFAFKGLFGFYKGYFSFIPYYQKIKEYSDGEMRNMWEYALNLNPSETEMLLRHIVELEDIYSDYYFIDENCSYNLLYLLEAARPDSYITDRFKIAVEPVDTIRAVRKCGFIEKSEFRPSLYDRLKFMAESMTQEDLTLAINFCKGKIPIEDIEKLNLSDERKAIILDMCFEYLKFMASKGSIELEDYKTRLMACMRTRNTIQQKTDYFSQIPVPIAPEYGHRSQRFRTGYGMTGKSTFFDLSYRFTSHSIMDPDAGFNYNSQIIFGETDLRFHKNSLYPQIEKLNLIDIISMPASNRLFFSPCWNFHTGFTRLYFSQKNSSLCYTLEGGSGLSFMLNRCMQFYIFPNIKVDFNSSFNNKTDLKTGFVQGILTTTGIWKSRLYANAYYEIVNQRRMVLKYAFDQRFSVSKSITLMANTAYLRNSDQSWTEFMLSLNIFF